MALFVRQDQDRSELQLRVAARLKEEQRKTKKIEPATTEPAALDDQHLTKLSGKVIMIFIVAVIVAGVVAYLISR